jgi:pSer/pThr/pTyr-binding forkhead associated (FHA) protein
MESAGTGGPSARAQPGRLPYFAFVEDGREVTFVLDETADRLTIGRGPGIDLRLDGDETVSQLHAELERLGRHWVVSDDGLSRHGSFRNGERIAGRHRLRDGDELRVGATTLTFRQPPPMHSGTLAAPTAAPPPEERPPALSDRQREVLIALARPFAREGGYSVAATNRQIAEETHLSVDAVKRHLRILFERFGIGSLPQNEKRVRLVELVLQAGLITMRDLTAPPS